MITSRSNPKVKLIRDLRDSRKQKESSLFFVEGIKLVGDAFDQGWKIETFVFSPELLRSEFGLGMIDKAKTANIEIVELSKEVFRSISEKDGPQGIAAVVERRFQPLEMIASEGGIWVGLDSVQDGGNLGTIIRTVDSAGASGIILIGNCVDPFSPEVVRASMGAIFSVKVIKLTLESFLTWQKKTKIEIIGSSDKGKDNYRKIQYPREMILLMGSEQKGLNQQLMDLCAKIVSIPMHGSSDSLNLAIATGIILYEIVAQNESAPSEAGAMK